MISAKAPPARRQRSLVAARDGLTAAEAEKAQVEAQRRELIWRRSNTEVTAPEDGVISRRTARIGAMATAAGEPMFRIIENSEIELDAEIVETELNNVKVGQKAVVTVPQIGDVRGQGAARVAGSRQDDAAWAASRSSLAPTRYCGSAPLRVDASKRARAAASRCPRPPSRSIKGSTSVQVVQRRQDRASASSRSASRPAISSR